MTFTATIQYENGEQLTINNLGAIHRNYYLTDRPPGTAIDLTKTAVIGGEVTNMVPVERVTFNALQDDIAGDRIAALLYYPPEMRDQNTGFLMATMENHD